MTTTTNQPQIPLPAGATYVDAWQGDGSEMPYRFIGSEDVTFAKHVGVWVAAVQYADGSIDGGRIEAPGVFIGEWRIPNDEVRELISVLQKSLALVEQWGTVEAVNEIDGSAQR